MSGAVCRRATSGDIPAILELQAANYVRNLSAEDRRDGFLSAEFTPEQFSEMAEDIGLMVACEQETVVGFVCASRSHLSHGSPVIAKMIDQFARVTYRGKRLDAYRTFIYGPVCIARSQRGRGLLPGLYEALRKEVAGRFEVGVAFVSKGNPRSWRAHLHKLGMTQVGEFEVGENSYVLLAFDVPVPQA